VAFGAGPGTLVGIAGAFASWEIWAPTFELLSPRWRVVAFDHDGVGQTKVAPDHITHERHLETFFSVLDAQRVERCLVAGDSNNACLAIEAVLQQPERFEGLAILNGHVWGFDNPQARRFAAGLRTSFEATVDFFVKLVFPEANSDHLQQWLRDIIVRTGSEAAARLVETFYTLDLRPRLSEVSIPTIIIHGVLDSLSPTALEDAQALAELIPGADLRLLDDAGHLPLLSRPEVVAAHLDAFLSATLMKKAAGSG
jgi:pimeloyl-ACP methyl ester carboxylesterase